MVKNNRKGFTLVELLAIILVLGIVVSISIVAINSSIKKAKEKTYQVTIKNVESQASNYLTENAGKLFFISTNDGKEYQCVTIQNLIDLGYLKDNVTESPITENRNVNKEDYIYLERDAGTKAITQSKYTYSNEEIRNCKSAVQATTDIAILVNPASGWAKQKTVTIEYRLKDLYDASELSNYLYGYTFNELSVENNETLKEFVVSNNGTVMANIKYNSEIINSKTKEIDGIDTTGPSITLKNFDKDDSGNQVTLLFELADTQSGVNTSSFTKNDLIIQIGDNKLTDDSYSFNYKKDNTYELKINSDNNDGKLIIQIDDNSFFDNVENGNSKTSFEPDVNFSRTYRINYDANGGNGAPEATTYTYATSGTVSLSSQKPTRTGYAFLGWSTNKNSTSAEYSAGGNYNKNVAKDVTLYAVWKANQVTIKYNANGGKLSAAHGANYSLDGNGNVLNNGNAYTHVIDYGSQLGSDGLLNYNNSSYLNVQNDGHSVASGSEWNTKADGTGTTYNQDTRYNANDFCNASSSSCEVTLYVNWKASQFRISYDANGGSGAPESTSYTYATSGTVSISSQIPTRDGYNFLGWATTNTATNSQYAAGSDYNKNIAKDVTLYAVWKINTLSIGLDGNGATSVGTQSVHVTNGSSLIEPSTIELPKREYTITYDANGTDTAMPNADKVKYTFSGWYRDSAGNDLIINNSTNPQFSSSNVSGYIENGTWIGGEGKTIYANWNTGYTTLPYLSKPSYRCSWNTKADGTGNDYPMGISDFTIDRDITLYANCTHVCCNATITNTYHCKEYGGSAACYRYSNGYINGVQPGYNFCETPASTCTSSIGWNECSYTFTTCQEEQPSGCYGSCPSGKHFDKNCNCVGNSGGSGSSGGGGCFLAGTKVMTTMGLKDINKLKIGDMVLTYNEKRGINEYHLVTHKFYFKPDEINESLYTLSIDDKTSLQVSSTHRFYVKRGNKYLWLPTKEMMLGDFIKYADGNYHRIINIKNEELTKPVYNLTVDDTHNFYVGEQLILVHNVEGSCSDATSCDAIK